jgi:hypothetical protein
LVALLLLGVPATPGWSQDRAPVIEVGTAMGLSLLSGNGSSISSLGLPGAVFPYAQPAVFFTHIGPSGLLGEQQINILRLSNGSSTTLIGLATRLGSVFGSSHARGGYAAVEGSLLHATSGSAGGDNTEFAVGAAAGYRLRVGTGLALRFEAHLRRWLDSDITEIGIGLGVGGVVK